MRKSALVGLLFCCAALVLGCPKKNAGADAAADAEADDAAVVDAAPPTVVNAKNTSDVARFPGETPVTDDDARLGQPTPVRTSPKTGTVIATLKPGDDVTKVAEYQGSILVTFPDPKAASDTLMGWITKESFNVRVPRPVDAGPKDAGIVDAAPPPLPPRDGGGPKVICPKGQVAVILTQDPVCKRKCTADKDCKSGAAGACANARDLKDQVVRVCASD